jgi:hypothetical protein
MGIDVDHLNHHLVRNNAVDDTVLGTQARGPVPFPVPPQSLIVKSLDQPKPLWARDPNDVLPFLVPLQDLSRNAFEPPSNPTMLIHLPHDTNVLYHI